MLKYVISLITSRSVCVDQVPYDVFGYEFLTDIFSCFGLLFIAGFSGHVQWFFIQEHKHNQDRILIVLFLVLYVLKWFNICLHFHFFFFASKNMQSEYCYRMSNNTAFQFLREELLKLLTLFLNWIKFWRNDCSNS